MKIKAKIYYTMKETHPDKDCVIGGWNPDEVYNYEDIYTINPNRFWGEDDIKDCIDGIKDYIKEDLKLIAGGGYNWKHIDNIRFEMEVIS